MIHQQPKLIPILEKCLLSGKLINVEDLVLITSDDASETHEAGV